MSDFPATPPVEVPPPADPPADAPIVEDAAPGGDMPEEPSLDRLDGEVDSAYLERLKNESIKHRLEAKDVRQQFEPWKDVLTGWDADEAAAVRELLVAAKEGNVDAIKEILGLGGDPTPEAQPAPTAEAQGYLTQADLERILSEREQRAQIDAQVKAIENEAKELGYEQGSNDYALLFKIAHEKTDGDLQAAHQQVQAWKQSLVDQFVAQKADAPIAPPSAGGPASGEREIRTLDDSKAAALARFNASPVQ